MQGDYAKLMQQAQSGQITPQQAQAQEKSLMARMNSLKTEEQSIAKNLADKTDKATKDLYKKVEEYFVENKSKYNCDFVMGYQTNGMILYFDKSMDNLHNKFYNLSFLLQYIHRKIFLYRYIFLNLIL